MSEAGKHFTGKDSIDDNSKHCAVGITNRLCTKKLIA